MQFVDRDGRVHRLPRGTIGQPFLVVPVEVIGSGDHGTGGRRMFGGQGDGVGLQRQQAMGTEDFIFVHLTRDDARDEQLPHA